jgi:hypothetical protein
MATPVTVASAPDNGAAGERSAAAGVAAVVAADASGRNANSERPMSKADRTAFFMRVEVGARRVA